MLPECAPLIAPAPRCGCLTHRLGRARSSPHQPALSSRTSPGDRPRPDGLLNRAPPSRTNAAPLRTPPEAPVDAMVAGEHKQRTYQVLFQELAPAKGSQPEAAFALMVTPAVPLGRKPFSRGETPRSTTTV